jgi:hypothetical protein
MLSGTRPLDPVVLSRVMATLLAFIPPERRVEGINNVWKTLWIDVPISVSILFPNHAGCCCN